MRTSMRATGIGLAAAILAVAAPFALQAEELRITIGGPGNSALNRSMRDFAQQIETRTNGAYTGKVYEGTLLNYAEAAAGVRDGIADVGYVVPVYKRAEFPLSNLAIDMATASMDPVVMAAAATEFVFDCGPCLDEYRAWNQVFLGYTAIGPYYLMTKNKVATKDDFKDKKIRGISSFGRWLTTMGATAVVLSADDIFESMNQGVIDGNTHTPDTLKSRSMGEVADWILDLPLGLYLGNANFNVNRDVWNGFDDATKKAFLVSAAHSHAYAVVNYLVENMSYLSDPASGGVDRAEPSADLVEATKAFQEKDLDTVADLNREKYHVADAAEHVQRMRALVDKWAAIFKDVDETNVDAVAEVYERELYGKIDPSKL